MYCSIFELETFPKKKVFLSEDSSILCKVFSLLVQDKEIIIEITTGSSHAQLLPIVPLHGSMENFKIHMENRFYCETIS